MLEYSEIRMSSRVRRLRTIEQEGIRIQRGHSERVNYVDARNFLRFPDHSLMRHLVALFIHLIAILPQLLKPGSVYPGTGLRYQIS
jgi:hypothetical protein